MLFEQASAPLFRALPLAVYTLDRDGHVRSWSPASERLFGWSEVEVLGRPPPFLPEDPLDALRQLHARALRGEPAAGRNVRCRTKDGAWLDIRLAASPLADDCRVVHGLIAVADDVTERRRLEEQLLQAQKMEAIGQLAGGIAHDFNNLLTVILGNISLLLNGEADPQQSRHLLQATEKAGWRAAELVRQLLSFSRQTVLCTQPTELPQLMDEIVAILGRTIDPRIRLEVRNGPDLWTIRADPGQVSQVLMNLCLNARDAMPDGGRIILEADNVVLSEDAAGRHAETRPGEYVRIRVSDNGHGMTPEVKARIFEPFFTTKGHGQGTGLGLAMVFGILKQHAGWIECDTEVNRGTRFDLYFPRLQPTSDVPPPPADSAHGGAETILLVDDEALVREIASAYLQSYGYRVLAAADGVQAVDLYRRQPERIALVILDLVMPGFSGRDILRRLRELNPQVRVLYSSGFPDAFDDPSVHEGVVGFLAKPYQPEELARAVRSALDAGKNDKVTR